MITFEEWLALAGYSVFVDDEDGSVRVEDSQGNHIANEWESGFSALDVIRQIYEAGYRRDQFGKLVYGNQGFWNQTLDYTPPTVNVDGVELARIGDPFENWAPSSQQIARDKNIFPIYDATLGYLWPAPLAAQAAAIANTHGGLLGALSAWADNGGLVMLAGAFVAAPALAQLKSYATSFLDSISSGGFSEAVNSVTSAVDSLTESAQNAWETVTGDAATSTSSGASVPVGDYMDEFGWDVGGAVGDTSTIYNPDGSAYFTDGENYYSLAEEYDPNTYYDEFGNAIDPQTVPAETIDQVTQAAETGGTVSAPVQSVPTPPATATPSILQQLGVNPTQLITTATGALIRYVTTGSVNPQTGTPIYRAQPVRLPNGQYAYYGANGQIVGGAAPAGYSGLSALFSGTNGILLAGGGLLLAVLLLQNRGQ